MKYNIGITIGVFDLLHVGHLNLLERCKCQCNHLIVGLCMDDYVRSVKHKEPIICDTDRYRMLKALECVDEVIPVSIHEIEDKLLCWNNHHFDVLFSGDDWKGSDRYKKTEQQFAEIGACIEYLPYTKGISTTDIVKKIKELYLRYKKMVSILGW